MSNPYFNPHDPVWSNSVICAEAAQAYRRHEIAERESEDADTRASRKDAGSRRDGMGRRRREFVVNCVNQGMRTAPQILAESASKELFGALSGRNYISTLLSNLYRKGVIKRVSVGVYSSAA